MFARKFDPSIYSDVLAIWDAWMAPKLASQSIASRQPPIGSSLSHNDPQMVSNVPKPTAHEHDALLSGAEFLNPHLSRDDLAPQPATATASGRGGRGASAPAIAPRTVGGLGIVRGLMGANWSGVAPSSLRLVGGKAHIDGEAVRAVEGHGHDEWHPHDGHAHNGHDHEHEGASGLAAGMLLMWISFLVTLGTLFLCYPTVREIGRRLCILRARLFGSGNRTAKPEGLKAF